MINLDNVNIKKMVNILMSSPPLVKVPDTPQLELSRGFLFSKDSFNADELAIFRKLPIDMVEEKGFIRAWKAECLMNDALVPKPEDVITVKDVAVVLGSFGAFLTAGAIALANGFPYAPDLAIAIASNIPYNTLAITGLVSAGAITGYFAVPEPTYDEREKAVWRASVEHTIENIVGDIKEKFINDSIKKEKAQETKDRIAELKNKFKPQALSTMQP